MEDRKSFIGGSDIAAVMGVSRWKSPLQLWAEKTGAVEPDDLTNNEAVECGIELEETVARMFSKKSGLAVRRAPKTYQYGQCPWMRCQVDRLVTGTDELLECKTASAWKEKEWEGEEIPAEYILQVQWQLMVTERRVGWIAVLIGGQKFRYKKIEADKELFESMKTAAAKFWTMVQDKTPPMACGMDNEALVRIYPNSNETMQLIEEMNASVKLLQELKMHMKELDAQKDDIEAKLKQVIGESAGILTSEYIVKWTPQERRSLNSEALKLDGLYEKYAVVNKTRAMRVTLNKEKANV